MRVAVYLLRPESRARVQDALAAVAETTVAAETADLSRLAALGSDAIVLQSRDARGRPVTDVVRTLRAAFPSMIVVAYCDPREAGPREVLDLARAGIDDLVVGGVEESACAIAEVLRRAGLRRTSSLVLETLSDVVPPPIAPVLEYFLDHASEPPTVDRAAAALAVHRKTLVNRFARAGWPPPSTVLSWARLMAAARMLEARGRTIEHAALQLGFESGNALRNMLRRHAQLRLCDVRRAGGLRCVLDRFRHLLPARPRGLTHSTPSSGWPEDDRRAASAGEDGTGRAAQRL